MKRILSITAAAAVILAAALAWSFLISGKAAWLRVEMPESALRGESFPVEVDIFRGQKELYLTADLHWMNNDTVSWGFLAAGKPVKMADGFAKYAFSVPIPKESGRETPSVFAVIYISRDGTWETRIKAGETGTVPLYGSGQGGSVGKMKWQTVRNNLTRNIPSVPDSVRLHIAVTFIWLACAVLAFAFRRRLGTKWIAPAAFFSALLEFLDTNNFLGHRVRSLMRDSGVYWGRRLPQLLMTLFAVCVFTAVARYLLMSVNNKGEKAAWYALLVYNATSIVHALSLHEMDALLSLGCLGIGLGQAVDVAASLLCLAVLGAGIIKKSYL